MVTLSEAPAWPLPNGHFFGPVKLEESNAACHSGKASWLDYTKLQLWQRHFHEVWDQSLDVTGEFDAGTQDAVETVQEAAGWEPSGHLDSNTWSVVWTTPPPEKSSRAEKKTKPTTRSAFKKAVGK